MSLSEEIDAMVENLLGPFDGRYWDNECIALLLRCKSEIERNERDAERMSRDFRRIKREMARLKGKVQTAHDLKVAAETRAHDSKLRAKTAEYGLRGLLQRCTKVEAALDAAKEPS